jgi:soluble lytic murein transglycosylase-like protein
MNSARSIRLFRSVKFAPLALIAFFLFINFTGLFFNRAMAPVVVANQPLAIPGDIPSSGDKSLDWIIFRAGERQGVDPRFIHAVIWQESKYKVRARSHAGAQGLMQLMPATAERFGCDDPHDPAENIEAGTKYLKWLLKKFDGNVELALAGYNAGEGSVAKYNGIPPYDETRNYVRIISKRYGKTYHPVVTPEQAVEQFNLRLEADATTSVASE